MIKITNLSNDSHQKTTTLLADNTSVVITLDFLPATQRWVAGITYGEKVINSVPLCVHPNLLRSFRQVLPFGLACVANDGVDPFDIEDFDSGRITLFLLDNTADQSDLVTVESEIYQKGL